VNRSLASIHLLDRHQHPHLRRDLDHPATSRHAVIAIRTFERCCIMTRVFIPASASDITNRQIG
jgi:hypothetical protein